MQGCGSINKKGQLVGIECESIKGYVCKRPIGKPQSCREGWDHHDLSCYKVSNPLEKPPL
jgi:hypothetical protein